MKNTLVQIGDVKQLQKVCLMLVDENNGLLKEPPTSWDAIKAGKFMIINGQHSITASQELQEAGCSEPRRSELQMWDAYIVWTLDAGLSRSPTSSRRMGRPLTSGLRQLYLGVKARASS